MSFQSIVLLIKQNQQKYLLKEHILQQLNKMWILQICELLAQFLL